VAHSIKADPALLEDVARNLEQIADDIRHSNDQLGTARDSTIAAWDSQHRPQFLMSTDKTQDRVTSCERFVRDTARKLRSTAREVRRVEAEIKSLKRQ
jgi:uncharacterized protein YukE